MLGAVVSFREHAFAKPLVLSAGPIDRITEARASVRVRAGGKEAEGRGSVLLSDLWAWPDPAKPHAERDAAMRAFCEGVSRSLPLLCGGESAHPWELGLRLHEAARRLEAPAPELARILCASFFDAAIHDGAGQALGRSAFTFYEEDAPIPSAEPFLPGGACRSLQRVLETPQKTLDAWCVVGVGDDLERDIRPLVARNGYRCFKLKIEGEDPVEDADRLKGLHDAARRWGIAAPRLTVDANEGSPDAASVLFFLETVRRSTPAVFEALLYVEQPTSRDIAGQPQDWRAVSAKKPVILDEGLTHPGMLETAAAQGWSGIALKTAKGHSFNLLAAAWAKERGLVLTLQDLTNVGHAAIHAAMLGSRLRTLNGIELNSPQYLPAANAEWMARLSGLFEPKDGVHQAPDPEAAGLGSRL